MPPASMTTKIEGLTKRYSTLVVAASAVWSQHVAIEAAQVDCAHSVPDVPDLLRRVVDLVSLFSPIVGRQERNYREWQHWDRMHPRDMMPQEMQVPEIEVVGELERVARHTVALGAAMMAAADGARSMRESILAEIEAARRLPIPPRTERTRVTLEEQDMITKQNILDSIARKKLALRGQP